MFGFLLVKPATALSDFKLFNKDDLLHSQTVPSTQLPTICE